MNASEKTLFVFPKIGVIELDDGNIFTGKPYSIFDGNFTHGFPVKVSP